MGEIAMTGKVKLENFENYLNEELRDKEFKKYYELERGRVALAQRIAEIRQQCRMRQVDLAKKMHVSQQFISQIESGQQTNITLDTLVKLAKSLGRGIKISFPKGASKKSSLEIA
jgi:DNA-binding XRE family transcriptional regulator